MANNGSVRSQVAEKIQLDNPTFDVKGYPVSVPSNIGANRAFVGIFRSDLTKPAGSPKMLNHEIKIQVCIGETTGEAAQDKLDDVLDDVLLSVERINGLVWSSATYAIFDEKYIGYEITATLNSPNDYKQIILEESKGA